MHQTIRRIAASKLLWAATVLLLLYSLGGFLFAPYLIGRYLPHYVQEHLEQRAAVGSVRINPFLLTLEASGFQLEAPDGGSMIAIERLWIDLKLSSLVRRAWTFEEVRFEGLDARLEIDRTGTLNLARLIERLRDPQAANAAPPRLVVEHLTVSDSRVDLVDLSGETRASVSFAPVNLELADFSTLVDGTGHYTLVADAAQGGSLAWEGSLSLQPLASTGVLHLQGIKLSTVWQFLRDESGVAEPRGELVFADARYDFSYSNGTPLLGLSALQAQVSDLVLSPAASASGLLALRTIRVTDARFSLADRTAVVAKVELADGEVRANVLEDGTLDWQKVTAQVNSGESLAGEPPAGQPWRTRVERVGVEKVALTYADQSTKPGLAARVAALNGSLMLDVTAGAGAPQVIAKDIQLAVREAVLATPVSGTPLATLDSFFLTGGGVDTRARSVVARSVAMSGGGLKIARDREGATGLLHALLSAAAPTASDPSAPPGPAIGATAWQYRIDAMKLERFDVGLADRSFDPEIAYDIAVVSAALTHIDSTAKAPIAFKTELRMGERGKLSSSGTVRQDFGQARAKIEVRDVALAPLRPLLARYARVDLKSGNLTAAAQLSYRPDANTAFTALGSASVDGFLMNESATGDRLLSWETLSADSIALSLSPDRLTIAEARLLEPGMKIVIEKDRSVNLGQLVNPDAASPRSSDQQATAGAASTPELDQHSSTAFPVEIGRIRLEGGTMDFADLSLILPFATKVHALHGSVVGVSSAPKSRARLQLAGQIETYGEARAEGALMPWRPSDYLDIEAHFNNVRMPPLSPYSATFAGRKVASGKLWLDLHYKIVEGELAGENKIALQDFKLGERVKAPNALDLPLDLAIALLTDSKGRISLAVPVTGDLDNPKFDYGSVIRAAIAGAISRVVTAPFRMLAGLFGKRNAEEFSKVEFEPGSERIAPAQREKLDSLAEALKERPRLKLVVRGPYHAKRDAEQLSRELARRDLERMIGTKLGPEEAPGPIAFGDADTQQALEKLFIERAGTDALRGFASQYAKQTGRQAGPVDPLPGRASGNQDFYEALFQEIVELQPRLDAAPQLLAAKRSQAIIDALVTAGLDRNRLQSGNITEVAGGANTAIASEFALEAMPGAP